METASVRRFCNIPKKKFDYNNELNFVEASFDHNFLSTK